MITLIPAVELHSRNALADQMVVGVLLVIGALATAGCSDASSGPQLAKEVRSSHSLAPSAVASTTSLSAQQITARFPVDVGGVGSPLITQSFAEFNDYKAAQYHTGIDIAPNAPSEHPTVRAVLGGKIVLVQQNGPQNCNKKGGCADHGFGNTIILRHEGLAGASSPADGPFYTQYSHLAEFDDAIVNLCPSFQKNKKNWFDNIQQGRTCSPLNAVLPSGAVLGKMGSSNYGAFSGLGIHLHFETKTFAGLNSTHPNIGCGGFGYTCNDPSLADYLDPVVVFHEVHAVAPPVSITINSATELFIGPDNIATPISTAYRKVADASIGSSYLAIASVAATRSCNSGWLELRPLSSARIMDAGESSDLAPSLPRAWACVAIQNAGDLISETGEPYASISPLLYGTARRDGRVSHIEAHNISYRSDPLEGSSLTGSTVFQLMLRLINGDEAYKNCKSAYFTLDQVGAVARTDNQATNSGRNFTFDMSGPDCNVNVGPRYAFYFWNVTNGNVIGGTIRVDANNDFTQQATWRAW